jgi:hypothetical protein
MDDNNYEEYFRRIRAAESGGNKYAKNPFKGQTASGIYQFTKGTFEGLGYDWKDRFDNNIQTQAAVKFTKQNEDYLKKRLGIKPNYADLYGAHFLGAAGYAKLYRTSNNLPISSVMSQDEIDVNPSYTKNKDGSLKTVGEVKAILAKKTGVASTAQPEEEQETSTYKPYVSYLQENAGTIETAGKYSEPKEVTEAKKEIYQAQQEENFLEALSNLQQQPQQTAPQQEQSYLENPELFQLAQVPQIQYEQFQDGGVIEKDNKWLQDWYATRVIPNKDIQGAYLEDKPIYTERLKNIPPVTKVDMIDNSPQKTGQYQGDTGKILMTPKAQPSVYTHEVNHYLNDFPSTMRTIHENIVEQNMYKKGDLRLGVNNENYDYLRNPDEIHSRVQVLRKDAGFRPDEEITEDRLYNYLQNYKGSDSNILQLMNLTDDKGLLDMLNYMAYNPKKNSAKENYAESGGIIKDNNGYWNPNNWGKTVEISSPSITMKGVKQPLVGYAPETGETKIMLPGEDYFFNGANRVIESQLIK